MRSPIVRAIVIFGAVALISISWGRLVVMRLPANRTDLFTTLRILTAAVLMIGGPIVGLFLGISHWWRNTRDSRVPPPLPGVVIVDAGMQRRRRFVFAGAGIMAGLALMVVGAEMVISAAWMAGGGDMPPGKGNPADMRAGLLMVWVCAVVGAIGLILFVTSIVAGTGLLLGGRE